MTEVKKTTKNVVAAFKGFNPEYKCRGFQHEIGKSYQTERSELCETSFTPVRIR